MSHIPEQINKINKNIIEAESILIDLKRRPKTENVAEQIEHFESMLNKLNSLKESYLQLSSQFEATNDVKNLSNLEIANDISSNNSQNVRNMLSSVTELEKLKQERDRLKRLLQERGLATSTGTAISTNIASNMSIATSAMSTGLEMDFRNDTRQNSQSSAPTIGHSEIGSDINNSVYMELPFYVMILNHHIDLGSKMVDMVEGLSLTENMQQAINLLKDVLQRLIELRDRFQCVQNAKKGIENQENIDSEMIEQEMETFSNISDELKINFATGVKCFKSAMDIIQSYLDPNNSQCELNGNEISDDCYELRSGVNNSDNNFSLFSLSSGASIGTDKKVKSHHHGDCSGSDVLGGGGGGSLINDHHNNSGHENENGGDKNNVNDDDVGLDDNDEDGYTEGTGDGRGRGRSRRHCRPMINDAEDEDEEDSIDSCHEKDRDESMEIGVIAANSDYMINSQLDHETMNQLRIQTEIEQKEIFRLLEEKRIMQQRFIDLKRAKEINQNQMMNLVQKGTAYEDFSNFLRNCQENDLDNTNRSSSSSIVQRPESLDLNTTGNMINEMGSLLKLLSDLKVDVNNDSGATCHQNHLSNRSTINANTISKSGKDSHGGCSSSGGATGMSLRSTFSNNDSPNNNNNLRAYNIQNSLMMPEMSIKNDDLQQQTDLLQQSQSRIQQLQEILNRIKKDSITLDETLNNESNNQYMEDDQTNDREISSNGRPTKGRDSVTFQEPVATFIANDELYENMREVRMRREELRDLSVRNSNSESRSSVVRVIDSGNAPGAPPEVPTRMPVANHDTASQDRTTAATWGSSSGGGDDYEENVPNNSIQNENIMIRTNGNMVSPPSNVNDEVSRVAPIGQSSTFRSKTKDSSSYIKNVIDADFANLKSQIENIATLCRNMALEQNRLARDISDLKRGSSPRINSAGPDLSINHLSAANNMPKHSSHVSNMLSDDNLQNWTTNPVINSNNGVPLTNISSTVRNGTSLTTADSSNNFCSVMRPLVPIDSNWDEASITSSNAALQLNSSKSQGFYFSPNNNYQNILHQQNMLLQNHSMFMKLQISLIASQLEQQRLMYNLPPMQPPNSLPYLQYPVWPMKGGIVPPFYPPPGPLPVPNWNMLQQSPDIITGSQHSNFTDPDYVLYPSPYQPESREMMINTSNPNTTSNMNVNSWKNPQSGRNIHRN